MEPILNNLFYAFLLLYAFLRKLSHEHPVSGIICCYCFMIIRLINRKSRFTQGWAFTNPGLRTGKQTNKVYGCLRSLATRFSVNSSFTCSFTAKCKVWFIRSSFTKHFNKSSFTKSLFTLISFTSSFVYCLFTNGLFTMDIMRFVYHYRLFT